MINSYNTQPIIRENNNIKLMIGLHKKYMRQQMNYVYYNKNNKAEDMLSNNTVKEMKQSFFLIILFKIT